MTIACDVYKGNNLLGSGTATAASASIASFTTANGNVVGPGRNVQVVMTAGNNIGASIATRVLTDGGTSLVLNDPIPYT